MFVVAFGTVSLLVLILDNGFESLETIEPITSTLEDDCKMRSSSYIQQFYEEHEVTIRVTTNQIV